MIIKHFNLKAYLDKKISFYLLYGQNIGLIEETIKNIIKPKFSNNIYYYDETEILADEDRFKESIYNKSFFENDKLIIINRGTDKIFNVIDELIEKKIEDIKIIIKSGVLEKKSKLRNFFEKDKQLIIIPFYEDNYQSLITLVQNFCDEKKIKISIQNINFIIDRSKGNRILLKNELDKIASYSKNYKTIELDDILKLTSSSENFNISELTDYCLAKNKKKTLNILNENTLSEDDNIIIIRNFLYKLKRLKKLKENLEINNNIETTLSSYKPTIFWKDKEIIKQQLKFQSLNTLKISIKKINELENLIKKNSQISKLILSNFILENLNQTSN